MTHDNMMQRLAAKGEDVTEYLLDAMEFLQNDDWTGYKAKFLVEEEDRGSKRRKTTREDITKCRDCKGPIITTGPNGTSGAVCSECGIVAWTGHGWNLSDNITFERMVRTKQRIHVYKRLVNYKDILRRIQADNRCEMIPEHRDILKDKLKGIDHITPSVILAKLKEMGIVEKHRRHKERLAWEYGNYSVPTIRYDEYRQLCKGFREYERAWAAVKSPNDKRKVFMSYACVHDQLCKKYGYDRLRVLPLMKSKLLLSKQYMYIAEVENWINKNMF